MNYEIVELENFSGNEATIYSIVLEGEELTLFDLFLKENISTHKKELKFILSRLEVISDKTGGREIFFKQFEGKPGDGVCALYDEPENKLRLYCIRYGKNAIILGGGGPKSSEIKAWQEDENLKKAAEEMIQVSKDIMERFESGDLKWSGDGFQLIGKLKITDNEEE